MLETLHRLAVKSGYWSQAKNSKHYRFKQFALLRAAERRQESGSLNLTAESS